MFEELFAKSRTIERYRAAPLAEERLRYLQHLRDAGVKPSTLQGVAASQLGLVDLVDFSIHDKVSVSEVETAAKEWARPEGRRYHGPASPEATAVFVGRAVQWLRFLGWLEEPREVRHPHTAEVVAIAEWMRRDRGFSEETIRTYCAAADEFFDWLSTLDIPLASVSMAGEDLQALVLGDDVDERRGAPQALSLVGLGEEDFADLGPGSLQDLDPLEECSAESAAASAPPREVVVRDVDEVRICVDARDDDAGHIEGPGVDPRVPAPGSLAACLRHAVLPVLAPRAVRAGALQGAAHGALAGVVRLGLAVVVRPLLRSISDSNGAATRSGAMCTNASLPPSFGPMNRYRLSDCVDTSRRQANGSLTCCQARRGSSAGARRSGRRMP